MISAPKAAHPRTAATPGTLAVENGEKYRVSYWPWESVPIGVGTGIRTSSSHETMVLLWSRTPCSGPRLELVGQTLLEVI